MTPLEWMDGSQLCAQSDGEPFFPNKGESPRPAIEVCTRCPLIKPCRDYALAHAVQGVWGGTTERTRDRMRSELGLHAASMLPVLAEDKHGTHGGIKRHQRRKEPLCSTCRAFSRTLPKGRRPVDGPDDARHGSEAGYRAGCRDKCCSDAMARARRRRVS